MCSRELSPKSYGSSAPEGRHLECRGRQPTAAHQLARRAASAQYSNTTCSIEPPLNPCHRRLHQLRLDKSYPPWLTNYSPPRRPRSGDRGLAPTALKMPPLPGLRTNESALIGSKMQVSQLMCSRELSPKSYGSSAPEGRHLECRGRQPTAAHQLARRAASAQYSNTTCSIEPPLNPCHRRLHQLRLDKSYRQWLTNYSPPR